MLIPFVIMLLAIAVAPIVCEKFWESNRNKFLCSIVLSIPVIVYMTVNGMGHALSHQVFGDYIPFIILLLSLFVVTGGIRISVNAAATTNLNSMLLALGFILASFMGTTGAAMLLIRPLLEVNKKREYKSHTILFFIAMVANAGGILTPLGDPPLFLLYLRGAPFTWFAGLTLEWLTVGVILLLVYHFYDLYLVRKESAEAMQAPATTNVKKITVEGHNNLFGVLMILLAVIFLNEQYIPAMAREDAGIFVKYLREIALAIVIVLSIVLTPKKLREANNYSWDPIVEVAVIFIGIFVTMTPALLFLNAHANDMGLTEPWQFYYSTGLLSSFLDNSPTAVAFHSVATGLYPEAQAGFVAGIPALLLRAISLGAVFFGAMTYIGNGPNFMVKAIAEQNGIKMPTFFGYIFKFSLIVLLPIYVIVQLIFL